MHKRTIILTVGFVTAVALTALAPSTVAWLQDDFVFYTAEGAEGDGPDPHLHPIIFLPIVCRSDEPAYTLPNTPTPTDDCMRYLNPPTAIYDGGDLPPGSTVCVNAGVYSQLAFRNLAGAPGAPIVIVNHGGQVRMTGDRDVSMRNCQHVRLTGTGVPGIEYGFYFTHRVLAYRTNTGLEFDHLEIAHCPYPAGHGIRVLEDPAGDPSWETNDIHVHHCYLHDLGNSALYLGRTPYSPGNYLSRRFTVHDNVVVNVPQGIQTISCVEECLVYDNYLNDVNPTPGRPATAAIKFNQGVLGKIYRNTIIDCEGVGVQLNSGTHPGDEVYNNLVVDCGKSLAGHRSAILTWSNNGRIYNNTVIGAAEYGVYMPDYAEEVEVFNNVILGTRLASIRPSSAAVHHNLTKEDGYTPANFGFVDHASGDYHLTAGSPALDAGSAEGAPLYDIEGQPRDERPDIGACEYH